MILGGLLKNKWIISLSFDKSDLVFNDFTCKKSATQLDLKAQLELATQLESKSGGILTSAGTLVFFKVERESSFMSRSADI
jgi:hypothetical protein